MLLFTENDGEDKVQLILERHLYGIGIVAKNIMTNEKDVVCIIRENGEFIFPWFHGLSGFLGEDIEPNRKKAKLYKEEEGKE
jgi:hypothetical protein